jgi:hypothetical protein
MRHFFAIVLTAGCAIGGVAASAQVPPRVPDVEIRIPAPSPVSPPPLNTFGDRMTQCLHQGSSAGLRGADLEGYARACAKEN